MCTRHFAKLFVLQRLRNDILSFVDFTKAFSLFDYDKDGVISIDDMRIVLKSLGHKISDEELDELIKSIDRNGKFSPSSFWLHLQGVENL